MLMITMIIMTTEMRMAMVRMMRSNTGDYILELPQTGRNGRKSHEKLFPAYQSKE